jgi:hypothetical protein
VKRPHLRTVLILLLASVVCEGCLEGQTQQSSPVVTLKRMPCFGMCPAYQVSVFSDGTVEWYGNNFIGTIGEAKGKLPKQQLEGLIRAILDSGFLSLANAYKGCINAQGQLESMSDLPTTFLTFSQHGVTKTTEDYMCAPDALRALETLVDKVLNTHQWRHDETSTLNIESIEPSYRSTAAEDLKNPPVVGSDVDSQTKPGFTKMMQAAGKGDVQSLSKEIESGADVNGKDETGWTALMMAAVEGQPDAVSVLLKHGAQPRSADKNGDTALIGAAANASFHEKPQGQVAVVQRLISAGSNVNETNQQGETALMWAAKSGNPELVVALLAAGADRNRRDRAGHDPAYHVQEWLSMRPNDTRRSRYQQVLILLQPAKR